MIYRILASFLVFSLNAVAAQQRVDLPSCDIQGQREVGGETAVKISDPRQAHISVRANVLSADIGTSRKARNITQVEADSMIARVESTRSRADRLVTEKGFLSAAERASFDRDLGAIAIQLCK